MTDSSTRTEPTAGDGATPAGAPKERFAARDLINIGVFTALYIVVLYAISMFSFLSPWAFLVIQPIAEGAAAIVFVLFLARVRHFGMVTVMGVILLLVLTLSGHPIIAFFLGILPVVAADAVAGIDRRSPLWASLSAGLFSLAGFGAFAPMIINRDDYLARIAQGPNAEYMELFTRITTLPVIFAIAVVAFILGALGGYLGSRMRKRHFSRAGIA